MMEILPNNADWDCFKTPILREILRIQNLRQVERYAFLEVYTRFQSVYVQETNFSFAQFNRIRSHFFGCRSKVGWYPLRDLIVAVLGNTNQSHKER